MYRIERAERQAKYAAQTTPNQDWSRQERRDHYPTPTPAQQARVIVERQRAVGKPLDKYDPDLSLSQEVKEEIRVLRNLYSEQKARYREERK